MIFDRLELVDDPEPRGAALNMAIDEAILEAIREAPVLRIYRWSAPAVSFGFFGRFGEVRSAFSTCELVRRWTGGGVVEHGADLTYSIIAPRGSPLAVARPVEAYAAVHGAIAAALGNAVLAAVDSPRVSQACFENPVRHDLLRNGRKLAGAAQRRTRRGLLHQGSICTDQAVSAAALAGAFAGQVIPRLLTQAELECARELATSRYGTREWLERR